MTIEPSPAHSALNKLNLTDHTSKCSTADRLVFNDDDLQSSFAGNADIPIRTASMTH